MRCFFLNPLSHVKQLPAAFMLIFICSLSSANSFNTYDATPWEICGLCHGIDGVSVMPKFPILAGQKADYLERQLRAFNSGLRVNDGGQMASISGEIRKDQYPVVAAYFSKRPPAFSPSSVKSTVDQIEQGQRIYERFGLAGQSCASCHSDPEADAPWLDMQHFDYLLKQLSDFRTGRRSELKENTPHLVITKTQAEAIAHYASSRRIRT